MSEKKNEDIFEMNQRLLYEKQVLVEALKKIIEACNHKPVAWSSSICKRIAIKTIEEVTRTKFIPL